MLVVWDVNTGTPKKTILNPHPDGVLALDINEDGNLIVTLSKAETTYSTSSYSLEMVR